MSIDNEKIPAIRHPMTRSMRLGRFSAGDALWTLSYGGISSIFVSTLGGFAYLMGAVLFAGWLFSMWIPETKRDERIYQMPFSAMADLGLSLKKGYVWKREQKEPRGKRQVTPFPLEVREFGDVGLIYNQLKRTYSMIISAEGSRITTYSALDQFVAAQTLGRIISKGAAAAGKGGLRFAMGFRARPQDPWLIPNTLEEVVDAKIINPVNASAKPAEMQTSDDLREQWLHEFLDEYQLMTEFSVSVGMYIVVTVSEDDIFKKVYKQRKLFDQDARRLRTTRIRNVIEPALEQLIGPIEVLDGDGAERYLRTARDIATLDSYYDMLQRLREEDDEVERELDHHLPNTYIRSGNDFVEIDGTFATVIKITSFPDEYVYAHAMQGMYDSATRWSSASVIGEAYRNNGEYTLRNGSSSLMEDVADSVGLIRGGAKAEQKAQQFEERQHEMVSAAFNQDFTPMVAVLATSREDLEIEYELEVDRLTAENIGFIRITGASKQLPSFLTAVTLVDVE